MENLKSSVLKYESIIENTRKYREVWNNSLKKLIIDTLEEAIKTTGMDAKVEVKNEMENLEVIALSMGHEKSGISEKIPNSDSKRPFIKSKGALIYQQLFNGKVMILIMLPYIENYGDPHPPRNLEILRPEEFRKEYILKHIETLFKELIDWEDFDDDVPQNLPLPQIGFNIQEEMN